METVTQSVVDGLLENFSIFTNSVFCEQANALLENGQCSEEEIDGLMEAASSKDSTVIRDKLYPIVSKSLSDKKQQIAYKQQIDQYMAKNVQCYSSIGPSTRPVLPPSDVTALLTIVGLTDEQIQRTLKEGGAINPAWKNATTSYNVAIVLSIRYFQKMKNTEQVQNGLIYLMTNIYQFMFWKYYKVFNPNESIMAYTVANLSQRFKLKKAGTIYAALMDITETCYTTHKPRIDRGTDIDFVKFINDATSRINSFMRKLRNEFEENLKSGNYLQSEHDDFSDEHYYEADNDSYAIDRITNKVLTNLVVNGPDRKLVELAARNSKVSVNTLQTSILALISEDNREDICRMIERLIALYLNDNPNAGSSLRDIGTNKFYVYCIKVYRQSNTANKNIIEIKHILDKWVVDLDLKNKVDTAGSIGNYRKAIFVFFVFTIEKLA